VRVSALLDDHPEIVTIDMNPLMVFAEGQGCVAVDAKIEEGLDMKAGSSAGEGIHK